MELAEYRQLVHDNTKDFKVKEAIRYINEWLSDYKEKSGTKKVVLGISGGKDSTVAAKLFADFFGKDNVHGILMPNGEQKDIDDALRVVNSLGISYVIHNIEDVYKAQLKMMRFVSEDARINIAPRIRMMTLYTYGQTHGYRVAGTGNRSERLLGYFTKWGDGACDFNVLAGFTSLEVMRIGEELGLPLDLVYKVPADGLSGQSDEERLGLSYIDIHKYIRGPKINLNGEVVKRIIDMKDRAEHKLKEIPCTKFEY